jgi:hypothetical protein
VAWLEYQMAPPRLAGDPYVGANAYVAGDQVYFDTISGSGSISPVTGRTQQGNFYEALDAVAAGESPTNAPTKWKLLQIPDQFSRYLPRACMADYLYAEQQFDNARACEAESEGFLDLELDRVMRQEGTVKRMNVSFSY